MDRNIINKHTFVLTGFALVFVFFGFVLYHEYTTEGARQSVLGYVVLEDGVRVSVDKMDEALVQEISSGEENPRVVVVLDEGVGREEFLEELQDEIVVEEGVGSGLLERGEGSGVLPVEPVPEDKSVFSFLDKNQEVDFAVTGKLVGSGVGKGDGSESGGIIAGEVKSAEALVELTENVNVKKIYLDYPVSVSLDESAKQINAFNVWNVAVNGSEIIGRGKSVCVIDTGVDYTHPALGGGEGGCNPSTYVLEGEVSALNVAVESSHPYSDGMDQMFIVQKEGLSSIAVHFSKIELEQISSAGDTTDRIYVYDGQNRTVAVYKGVLNDVWSPAVAGDTLYIRLVTDGSVTGYGFLVDSVINGTTNVSMDWSKCNVVKGGYDVYNNDADPKDDHGHGTHVAGIIGSRDATYRGVAPGAGIIALKALSGGGSGYASDVLAALEWCTSNAQKYNISVISMSLGCDGGSCPHYQSACDDDLLAPSIIKAVANNVMVTIASGNSGWVDGISSPGCISSAISVGGVNSGDEAMYNRGTLLQLVAPAQGIMSSVLSEGWKSLSGTSMATPHVAGAIVLLQDYVGRVNGSVFGVDEVKFRFAGSGKQIFDSGAGLNFSRVDVYAALGVGGGVVVNETFTNTTLNESLPGLGNVTNETNVTDGTNATNGFGIVNTSVARFGLVMRSVENVTVNDSVLFSVGVNESVLNVSTVVLSYTVNGSEVVNRSMVLNVTRGLFEVMVNNSGWLVNTSVVYWAGAMMLQGNYTQSELGNFTVQMAALGSVDSGNSSGGNSSFDNSSSVNQTIVPVIAFNITSPLDNSIVEVGGVLNYNVVGVGGNDSIVWVFGDGTNSTFSSGEKQMNSTGQSVVQLLLLTNETVVEYNRIVVVNDTVGPVISNVSFVKAVDYSKNISQMVSAQVFDYSGVAGVNLSLGNQSFLGNCTNGTLRASCRWTVLGLGVGNTELLLTATDGFSVAHVVSQRLGFAVTACADTVKNGDELGIDCGGSCGVCANTTSANTTSVNATIANVTAANVMAGVVAADVPATAEVAAPVAAETKVEESKAAEVKPEVEVKKAEQAVSVAAKTEGESGLVVAANMSALRVPEELVSQEVERKYTVLYILGTMIAGLAGLYVFMMRDGM